MKKTETKTAPSWAPSLDAEKLEALKKEYPGLIRLPRVKELTSLGKTTIYSMLNAGRFPDRMKLSRTVSAWQYADVMAWIEEQGAAA